MTDEGAGWLAAASGRYTYTTTFTGATMADAPTPAVQHLEGDFLGCTANLHYPFALDGALIRHLVIEP